MRIRNAFLTILISSFSLLACKPACNCHPGSSGPIPIYSSSSSNISLSSSSSKEEMAFTGVFGSQRKEDFKNNNVYLDKPVNTNLKFWITQKVTYKDFTEDTYIPGWFGAEEYLDSRYEAIIGDEQDAMSYRIPDIHVTYLVTAYTDYTSPQTAITRIEITDPEINVYDVGIQSTKEEIEQAMLKEGFMQHKGSDGNDSYYKNNCVFYFTDSKLTINAYVTNKNNVVF